MSRVTLKLAPRHQKPAVPRSLIKQAVRLFRSDMAPRSVRRANARKWIRAVLMLGDKHLYRGGEAKWSGRRT